MPISSSHGSTNDQQPRKEDHTEDQSELLLRETGPVIDAAGKWPGIMIIMTALLLRFAICIVSILALSKGAWHFLG